MKNSILLVGINAKYIHSNLAIRYLKKYCRETVDNINIMEFSINDHINNILKELYSAGADVYAFSCYIWNIEIVLKLCTSLKKAKPEAVIILGGPEVSYDAANIMEQNSYIDYIVIGEGEATFLELAGYLYGGAVDIASIRGLAYRSGGRPSISQPRPLLPSLDVIPFPYDDFRGMENKIIYYETSRGCPFNCQYCLSSTISGVRYLSMDRIRSDIQKFVQAGLKQVKLVDRTFNCNANRAVEIMEYIISLKPDTNFHFEIAADLVDDKFVETVSKAPKGLFQFEIGVQSTNLDTLSEIKRVMDFEKVCSQVQKLISLGNAHIHLDLIAGLPYEGFESFKKSFNDVYMMKPHMLQLGFLKLLKGSGLREHASLYGIEYHDFSPYEVIKTDWISYGELLILKDIEELVELYNNSGRFRNTLDYLLNVLRISPFEFYNGFAGFWSSHGHYKSAKGLNELYTILYKHAAEIFEGKKCGGGLKTFNELIKLDWLLYCRNGSMPGVIERYDHSKIKEAVHEYIKSVLLKGEELKAFIEMSFKEVLKYVSYEVFYAETVYFFVLDPDSSQNTPDYFSIPLKEIKQLPKAPDI